jgi:hypothetical protein
VLSPAPGSRCISKVGTLCTLNRARSEGRHPRRLCNALNA